MNLGKPLSHQESAFFVTNLDVREKVIYKLDVVMILVKIYGFS